MPLVIATPFNPPAPPVSGSGLCAGGESDFFGPSFFTEGGGNIVWDGVNNQYDLGQQFDFNNSLDAIGGAWSGFRPSAIKITITMNSDAFGSDDWDFKVRDTASAVIATSGGFVSVGGPYPNTTTFTYPITFGANDIGSVSLDSFSYDSNDTLDAICFVP